LTQLAAREGIAVFAGMAERDFEGRIFASHVLARPGDGLGVYRKLHVAPPEMGIFSPGNDVSLFVVETVRIGIQLCWDAHFPELSTRMALEGADLILMPHASPKGTPNQKYRSWLRHLPARAYDNGLYVIACNQTGESARGLKFPGVAIGIAPSGQVLEKRLGEKESMMIVDLKADKLASVRNHRMRYFLPHRRPEVYWGRKE
jgi:N-carbamoylputrescine amidase